MCVIMITTVFNVFSSCVPVSLSTIITMFVMQIMNISSLSIALSTCTHALYFTNVCTCPLYFH